MVAFIATKKSKVGKHTPLFALDGNKKPILTNGKKAELRSLCIVREKSLVKGESIAEFFMVDGIPRERDSGWGCYKHFISSLEGKDDIVDEAEMDTKCKDVLEAENSKDKEMGLKNVPEDKKKMVEEKKKAAIEKKKVAEEKKKEADDAKVEDRAEEVDKKEGDEEEDERVKEDAVIWKISKKLAGKYNKSSKK